MSDTSLPNWESLARRLESTLLSERHRLSKALAGLQQRAERGQPFDRSLGRFLEDLKNSESRFERRRLALPAAECDATLPIFEKSREIAEALTQHQVLVICGETGSGKSTQLPKICLAAGRGIAGMIGHTQPRRIAARSVAARVAEELQSRIGDAVAFKIRFTDTTSPGTLIKLMTDGVLLAESQSDRFLNQYDTIIVDEAHERSLNIDFLLGYLKRLLPQRPELRVIITSATIDAERFAEYFSGESGPAPVIEVSGRTYPVEIRYRPPTEDEEESEDVDFVKASADACEDLLLEGHGDILVFMPTERDIRETARVLQGRPLIRDSHVETVPLFGRLTEQEQNRVFAAHARRRIVIATNVAESSLTVPGIYCVVDPGTARISRFSATSQVQRLPIEPVSQASANQRAGRCGRVGPGVCVRLYSAEDFAARDAYTPPEILRTNLASVLLQMKSLQLGRIEEFPFLDPPGAAAVRAGLKTLFELNAIDEEENLTAIGKAMARLPVDPRIGRMILAAADEHCLSEVLIIASALELRDPRDRPLDKQQAADTAHARFRHERSDFMTLLKLWDFFIEQEEKQSNSKIRKVCQQNFLSYNRLREWKDLHRQLRDIVRDHGFKSTDRKNDEQAIHRAILCGTLSNVAQRGEGPEYTGAGGQKLYLWPGSVAFESRPKWIMGAELVETTRRFVRMVGPIQPQWVESAAAHLVKRTYSEPFWNSKQAAVMAYEKVSLFGLVVVPRRECRYGQIDPKVSRELFIQHALIEGDLQTNGEFFRHNAALKAEIAEWQAKVRQGLQFLGEEAEFDFYDQRLPAEAVDGPRFEQWRKTAELQHPRLLFLSREDLVVDTSAAPRAAAFPDTIRIGTMQVPVEYQLEPGSEADGVTLVVPSEGLNQLSEENLSWLVPGLLEEKVAAVMKTLPKSLRLLFVPIPETATRAAGLLSFGQGHLLHQLSETLRRISGEYVPVTAFDTARIPEHLKFNVRVIDRNGRIVAEGRELSQLRAVVQAQAAQILEQKDSRWNREGIRHWDFGALPEQVQLDRHGTVVVAFPMLIRREQDVALALAGSLEEAETRTRPALVQLYLLQAEKRLSEQVRHFPRLDDLALQLKILPGSLPLKSQILQALARESLLRNGPLPRSEADWTVRMKQAQGLLPIVVQDLARILGPLLTDARTVQRLIGGKHPAALAPLAGDLRLQFAELFPEDFIAETPFGWMQHYGRYLQAMQSRFAKATSGGFEKDRRQMQLMLPYVQRFRERRALAGTEWRLVPGLVQYRHLLEEFRVSLFAQQLRTAVPVSEKRLNELWASISS